MAEQKLSNQLNKVLVLIPAYNPDEKLIVYVDGLKEEGIEQILVIDDGSRAECTALFQRLEQSGVNVVHHGQNMGKGRGLKTGFSWCLEHMPECCGVVTADSDGQHSPKDTRRVAEALLEHPEELILGTRNFNEEQVPFKSRYGNKITSVIYKLLYGSYLHDTQTGLRGISRKYLKPFMELAGERFEYEIRMLIAASRNRIPFREVMIETIYIDENKETHFHPVKDSVRIYRVMFAVFIKYLFSSLSASVLDIASFAILNNFVFQTLPDKKNIFLSTMLARVLSSLYNFTVNRKVVFRGPAHDQDARQMPSAANGDLFRTLAAYYILVVVQMGCSAGLVYFFTKLLGWPATIVKVVVDSCLFLLSFRIQQRFVFKR